MNDSLAFSSPRADSCEFWGRKRNFSTPRSSHRSISSETHIWMSNLKGYCFKHVSKLSYNTCLLSLCNMFARTDALGRRTVLMTVVMSSPLVMGWSQVMFRTTDVIGHRCRSLCLERVWNINAWDPWPPAPRSGRVWGTRWAQLTSSDLRSLEHATTRLSYFKTSLKAIHMELVFLGGGDK